MNVRNYWIVLKNVEVKESNEENDLFGRKLTYMRIKGDAKKFMDLLKIEGYSDKKGSRYKTYRIKKLSEVAVDLEEARIRFWNIYRWRGHNLEFDCECKNGIDILLNCHEVDDEFGRRFLLVYDEF